MDIIKISLLGICGVILGFLLKGTGPEYAGFITMGIGIMILGLAVGKLEYLFQSVSQLKDMLPVSQEYFATLIKMIGSFQTIHFQLFSLMKICSIFQKYHSVDHFFLRIAVPVINNTFRHKDCLLNPAYSTINIFFLIYLFNISLC